MKEILGFQVDEVAAVLWMSPRTIERCFKSFRFWRRQSVAMHPHVEFFIMEAMLEHPEKTLSEIVYSVYAQTGSKFL